MKINKYLWLSVSFILITACQLPFNLMNQTDPDAGEAISFSINKFIKVQPSITQTPTLTLEKRLEEADTALFAGELERAKLLFQESFESAEDDDSRAEALFGLGRSYYTDRNFFAAIDAFNRILGQYPDAKILPDVSFMIAECYFEIEEYQQASNAYTKYAELKPGIIDRYALTLAGDSALYAGNNDGAIFSYQAALAADPSRDPSYLNLQIGRAYEGLQDYTTAIQYYLNVYDAAADGATKATANLLAGQAYLQIGQPQEAYNRLMDSVIQFPQAFDSFTALTILVNNSIPVNEFDRGLVDYYAGSYEFAVQAFERYLASNPDNNDGTAHYFKGLSHYNLGEYRDAVAEYDKLINNFPGNTYWPLAWEEKAFVQWLFLDEITNAAETYLAFVYTSPSSNEAVDYLYRAGRVYESAGILEQAAAVWQRMMDEYPSSELSYNGLFKAGLSYYRLGRFEEALSVFQRNLVLGTNPAERAKAYLWIGKCFIALEKPEDAENAWELGKLVDPTDYYSIRPGELLDGKTPYSVEEFYDLGYDLTLERPEADAWLIETFNLPPETDFSGLGDLENDIRIQRMRAFWKLGLYINAVEEAELLRADLQGDMINTYRLMNDLISLRLYQPAIYASRHILDFAGLDDLSSLSAPIYFTHIRFGAYFRELLVPIANEYNVHPLLYYALVRQESMFNPYIGSSAGALGLAQIIPSTAQDIQGRLNWPKDFETNDLYLGEVSLTYGAYYLDFVGDYLSGNNQAALAAYNAGPGNSESWKNLSDGDPDLFFEIIPDSYLETKNYLELVAEFLSIYKLVYSRPQ